MLEKDLLLCSTVVRSCEDIEGVCVVQYCTTFLSLSLSLLGVVQYYSSTVLHGGGAR